ncbi:MAG: ECF transporter S component [Oscillospiraceae bacterium]|nr:ECF transporter S component [Oscillospiraceae bacterium]
MEKKQPISTKRIVLTALMAALTVAGSAIRVTIPIDIGGNTSFHLGNIMCALSGILLGPGLGGLAAGLGSFLYDMTNPLYISEAWITFLTKGAYGLVPGLVMLLWKKNWGYIKAAIATTAGAVTYAVLYLLKTYFKGIWVQLLTSEAATIAVVGKLPATVFNAAVAILFAPILAVAIRKALEMNRLTLD